MRRRGLQFYLKLLGAIIVFSSVSYFGYTSIANEKLTFPHNNLSKSISHSTSVASTSPDSNRGRFVKYGDTNCKMDVDIKCESKPDLMKDKHKLVHLDLKGSPPSISYLRKIIPYLSQWGATGLLIEYEDTFPYSGELSVLSAKHAYQSADIAEILELSAAHNLDVIPLIQTYGHMEFVLKHGKFAHLREVPLYSMVINPSLNESQRLIETIIDQILAMHPAVKYLHIGCDEVYNIAENELTQRVLRETFHGDKTLFFLNHVVTVAKYVREKRVTPIIWDDMIRTASVDAMKQLDLGRLVEPMVWNYRWYNHNQLYPPNMWANYAAVFPRVWGASCFKGSTNSDKLTTPILNQVVPQVLWLNVINELPHSIDFRGVALTGWSRYDHFAIQCELLPVSVPSLVVCLRALDTGCFTNQLHEEVSRSLGFLNPLRLESMELDDGSSGVGDFPGANIYQIVVDLNRYLHRSKDFVHGQYVAGWLNPAKLKRNQINLLRVDDLQRKAKHFVELLSATETLTRSALVDFMPVYHIDELIESYVEPVAKQLQAILEQCESIRQKELSNLNKNDAIAVAGQLGNH